MVFVFAIDESSSLLANLAWTDFAPGVFSLSANFSLPCVSYALLTKICFWSWLQRDVALYLDAVVSLDVWNDVDADVDKQRRSREQIMGGEASSSVRAQRDLFCFGLRICCDTRQ